MTEDPMSMWLSLVLGCTMFVFQTAQPKNNKQVPEKTVVPVQQPAVERDSVDYYFYPWNRRSARACNIVNLCATDT